MESRPTGTQDYLDGRLTSTPVSTSSNYQDDLKNDESSENKVTKSAINVAGDRSSIEPLKAKPGRTSLNLAMTGAKGNEEDEGESSPTKEIRRRDSKWEVLSNLESGTQYTIRPKKSEGYLAKRRRWPLKGWHKR